MVCVCLWLGSAVDDDTCNVVVVVVVLLVVLLVVVWVIGRGGVGDGSGGVILLVL